MKPIRGRAMDQGFASRTSAGSRRGVPACYKGPAMAERRDRPRSRLSRLVTGLLAVGLNIGCAAYEDPRPDAGARPIADASANGIADTAPTSVPLEAYLGEWSMPNSAVTIVCPSGNISGRTGGRVLVRQSGSRSVILTFVNYCSLALDLGIDAATVRPDQPCTTNPMVGSVFQRGRFVVSGTSATFEGGGDQYHPEGTDYIRCTFTKTGDLTKLSN